MASGREGREGGGGKDVGKEKVSGRGRGRGSLLGLKGRERREGNK